MLDDYLRGWLVKAERDLKVAANELHMAPEDLVSEAVCFHAQQAVEKFLKAYLIANDIAVLPPKSWSGRRQEAHGTAPEVLALQLPKGAVEKD